MSLRINRQSEASEVFVKGEAWNIIKHMGNNNIRNSITKKSRLSLESFLNTSAAVVLTESS